MRGAILARVFAGVFALVLGSARAGAAEPITIGFGMALTGQIAATGRFRASNNAISGRTDVLPPKSM